jgi:hypothetical protein
MEIVELGSWVVSSVSPGWSLGGSLVHHSAPYGHFVCAPFNQPSQCYVLSNYVYVQSVTGDYNLGHLVFSMLLRMVCRSFMLICISCQFLCQLICLITFGFGTYITVAVIQCWCLGCGSADTDPRMLDILSTLLPETCTLKNLA